MNSAAVDSALARFFGAVPAGAEVITPTRRLARFLREAAAARAETIAVPVLAFEDWWRRLFYSLPLAQPLALLPPHTGRELWQQAAARAGDDAWLLADGLADWASRAYGELTLWRQQLHQIPDETAELQLLQRTFAAFEEAATALGACTPERGLSELVRALESGAVPALTAPVVLTGFDELSPLAQALCDGVSKQGLAVARLELEMPAQVQRAELPTVEDEWRAAALWAAQQLAAAPTTRIAVVVPNLTSVRQQVARVFNEVLDPAHSWPDRPRRPAGFNMSAAENLAQTPLIVTALELLGLNQPELTPLAISELLQSPHWGAADEYPARALLGDRLRAERLVLSPRALLAACAQAGPALAQTHQHLREFLQLKIPSVPSGADIWADVFDQQLAALGFARARPLDSVEYQQLSAWTEVLADFASLRQVAPAWGWGAAMSRLRRMASRPFQPETLASPVQILGMLEAAGQIFDALWITGLSDQAWPESPRLNPLLPARWQRALGLPRTTADGELALATRLTERLALAASTVVFSSPALDADRPLAASALIAHFPVTSQSLQHPWQAGAAARQDAPDWRAPPLATAARRGGAGLLRDQAACPFKAFARHRLAAADSQPCKAGLDARQRGILLHAALEQFWAEVSSQQQLLALDAIARVERIERAIDLAARSLPGRERLGAAQLTLERSRSRQLLNDWLDLEARRPPFTVVAQEAALEVVIGPLTLNLRFDRLDRLAAGGVAVVDYKTSSCQVRAWDGERPDEPQVPLYALAMADRGAAVAVCAFAELRAEGVRALGLANNAEAWPELPIRPRDLDLPEAFADLLQHWRTILVNLAQAFADGWAMPTPKAGLETCRRCDLQPLCRASVGLQS